MDIWIRAIDASWLHISTLYCSTDSYMECMAVHDGAKLSSRICLYFTSLLTVPLNIQMSSRSELNSVARTLTCTCCLVSNSKFDLQLDWNLVLLSQCVEYNHTLIWSVVVLWQVSVPYTGNTGCKWISDNGDLYSVMHWAYSPTIAVSSQPSRFFVTTLDSYSLTLVAHFRFRLTDLTGVTR